MSLFCNKGEIRSAIIYFFRLLAQTTLRNILGTKNLHEILSDRESISSAMQVGPAWDGEAEARGGSCWEILNYILIKKTVLVVGEDLVYFSL